MPLAVALAILAPTAAAPIESALDVAVAMLVAIELKPTAPVALSVAPLPTYVSNTAFAFEVGTAPRPLKMPPPAAFDVAIAPVDACSEAKLMLPAENVTPPAMCVSNVGFTFAFAIITPNANAPTDKPFAEAVALEFDVEPKLAAPLTETFPPTEASNTGDASANANGNWAEINPPPDASATVVAELFACASTFNVAPDRIEPSMWAR